MRRQQQERRPPRRRTDGEGNFHDALERYDAKGAIHWTRTQPEARAALVAQWAKDSAADPTKSRFVFAYTNADVDQLNRAIRAVRKERGELGGRPQLRDEARPRRVRGRRPDPDSPAPTSRGASSTARPAPCRRSTAARSPSALDGRGNRRRRSTPTEFQDFRHGYAGTIYKGQGRTLDQTYLYHSEHWRSAASYVALTRHRDKAELFVARNTAPDLKQLARQMARVDDRRAASHFYHNYDPGPVRPLNSARAGSEVGYTQTHGRTMNGKSPSSAIKREAPAGRGNVSDHTSAKDSRQARLDRPNDTRDFGDGHNRNRTHGPRGRPHLSLTRQG